MSSSTDRRILAINRAIARSAYDEEINEQLYEPFEGGYNRQRGRYIFAILLLAILFILYVKYKQHKK
jgi:hypothetical protein